MRLSLLSVLLFAACGNEGGATPIPQPSQPPQTGQQPPATMEPQVPPADPNDPIASQMALRATQFAEGMTPATPIFRGTLQTGENQDYQAILQSDRCFRVIGVGATTVTDLDLFLFDPNGIQMQQDTAVDAYPVLGLTHPICPDLAGSYRVQVRMYAGSGDYGVQVFYSERR
jgi:hypothetical protein